MKSLSRAAAALLGATAVGVSPQSSSAAVGRMVLRGRFGKEIHTFSVLLSKAGKPRPKLGVAPGFGKGRHTDVSFLEPKKK